LGVSILWHILHSGAGKIKQNLKKDYSRMTLRNLWLFVLSMALLSGCQEAPSDNILMQQDCTVAPGDALPLANGGVLQVKHYAAIASVQGKVEKNNCVVVNFSGTMELPGHTAKEVVTASVSGATYVKRYSPKAKPDLYEGLGWVKHDKHSFESAYLTAKTGHRSLMVKFPKSSKVLTCQTAELNSKLNDYDPKTLNGVCSLPLDMWGAQGSINFKLEDLPKLEPALTVVANKVSESLEPAVEVLSGVTYFKYPPGSRAPRLYFETDDNVKIDLHCGCGDRCGIPERWLNPEVSKITIKRYGFGRPVILQLENMQQSRVVNYRPCNK